MTQSLGRKKQSKTNIIFSLGSKLLLSFLPFLIRALIIRELGVEYLGLNSLFTSILQTLSLTELGFSSAITFALYAPVAKKDFDSVSRLLNFYRKIYWIVGGIITTAGLILIPFLKYLINSTYPNDINIYLVYLVFLLNTSVSYFLFSFEHSIVIAEMRNDVNAIITTIKSLLMYILQVILLLLTHNYYVYIICLPISTIFANFSTHIYVRKKFPKYKPKGSIDKNEKKKIMKQVGSLVGNKIGAIVFSSVDSIVISSFLGLAILGKYDNYYLIVTSLIGFVMVIFDSVQSIVGNSLVTKTENDNYDIFSKIFSFNCLLSIICSTCLFTSYQTFMAVWVGQNNMLPDFIPFLLTLYFFVRCMRRTLVLFKESAGMWVDDFMKPYVSVIVNLSVNILLVNLIGLAGVVISSIVALIIIEIPWETYVFFKKHFSNRKREYLFDYFSQWIIFAICLAASYALCSKIGGGVINFILKLFISSLISFFTFFVIEKRKINDIFWLLGLKKIKRRKL